jgi:small subunit ribosomal protein S13
MAPKVEEAEQKHEKREEKKKKPPELEKKRIGHVVRIHSTDIEGGKKIIAGIGEVKGVGINLSNAIINRLGLDRKKRLQDLTEQEIDAIEKAVEDPCALGVPAWMLNRRNDLDTGRNIHLHTADLIFAQKSDIDMMGEMKSYKGLRHSRGQKVRGQRTASTGRGRVAVGVLKKRSVAQMTAAAKDEKKR